MYEEMSGQELREAIAVKLMKDKSPWYPMDEDHRRPPRFDPRRHHGWIDDWGCFDTKEECDAFLATKKPINKFDGSVVKRYSKQMFSAYESDMNTALRVVTKMEKHGYDFKLKKYYKKKFIATFSNGIEAMSSNPAEAICRAALMAYFRKVN